MEAAVDVVRPARPQALDAARCPLPSPMRRKMESRHLRLLPQGLRPRPVVRPWVVVLVLPARVLQLPRPLEAADAEARSPLPPALAAHPRAAASPTGPATERSRRAFS